VAIARIDDGATTVTAEWRDHRGAAREQQRLAVVLEAAPEGESARDRAGARRVVLEGVQRGVQIGPAGRVADRPAPDATVIAEVHDTVAEGDGVLVGVRRLRAAVEPVRGAGQPEVPVRTDRGPRGAAVGRLVDLLEADVQVIRVGGVDAEEL